MYERLRRRISGGRRLSIGRSQNELAPPIYKGSHKGEIKSDVAYLVSCDCPLVHDVIGILNDLKHDLHGLVKVTCVDLVFRVLQHFLVQTKTYERQLKECGSGGRSQSPTFAYS